MDWGSAKPFSVGWWAIADDPYPVEGRTIPRGALVRYREWYGAKQENGHTVPNVGLKLTAEQVAKGIMLREAGEKITYGTLDPAAFAEDGGPSIAQRMMTETRDKPVLFKPADNKRVSQRGAMGGWDMMRQRLIGEDGTPMIYCFSTCVDSIRTIPVLQHDETRGEDLDTDSEDHAADEWRYACMSRPFLSRRLTNSQPEDRWAKAFKRASGGEPSKWKTA
jgi:hypothetical protein